MKELLELTALELGAAIKAGEVSAEEAVRTALEAMEEREGALNFDSLRWMAEQLEGSYTVTLLGPKNELYFIKGDNPMCLYHYPSVGLYLYASTEEILNRVLRRLRLPFGKPMPVSIQSGGILKIDEDGHISYGEFDDSKLFSSWRWPGWYPYSSWRRFGE